MPRYDFKCDKCHDVKEIVIPIATFDPNKTIACNNCGNGERWYKPSYTSVTNELCGRFPYFDSAADRTFDNKEQYRNYCHEHDLDDLRGIVLV